MEFSLVISNAKDQAPVYIIMSLSNDNIIKCKYARNRDFFFLKYILRTSLLEQGYRIGRFFSEYNLKH